VALGLFPPPVLELFGAFSEKHLFVSAFFDWRVPFGSPLGFGGESFWGVLVPICFRTHGFAHHSDLVTSGRACGLIARSLIASVREHSSLSHWPNFPPHLVTDLKKYRAAKKHSGSFMHGRVQTILSFAAFGLLATNIPISAHSASGTWSLYCLPCFLDRGCGR
jgi:hypothetical protein